MRVAILKRIACLVVMLSCLLMGICMPVEQTTVIYASTVNFDNTNVLDDLESSGIDLTLYTANENGYMQVINFVEYCYAFRSNQMSNYGLYLYIYNPRILNINETSVLNKIEIATKYNSNGEPNDYEKFTLKFCSTVNTSTYYKRFYKYKIIDRTSSDGKTIAQRVRADERRYDISSFELHEVGKDNATDYNIGGTFKFKGFTQGYGFDVNADDNLEVNIEYLETVRLDLNHTYYRTATSNKGADYSNQLDSVYFAVPQRLFDLYGTLQRIKAEWYEYKTKPIVVTKHQDFYNRALPYMGVNVSSYNSSIYYSLFEDFFLDLTDNYTYAKFGWNKYSGDIVSRPVNTLYYLFYNSNIQGYDPYGDKETIGGVESTRLYEYMKNYSNNSSGEKLEHKNLSVDLFENDIDASRKMNDNFGNVKKGYSYYDFDASVNLPDMISYVDGNPSFWQKWLDFGLWDAIWNNIPSDESFRNITPIEIIRSETFVDDVSKQYLINKNDVSDFKTFVKNCENVIDVDKKTVPVLFRFAVSDYYRTWLDIIEQPYTIFKDTYLDSAYMAQGSVFLDFDVIQLTFAKDGVYHVIPVVSNPIDIILEITPPPPTSDSGCDVLSMLSLALIIVLIVVLFPFLSFVVTLLFNFFKALIKLIAMPFKRKKK